MLQVTVDVKSVAGISESEALLQMTVNVKPFADDSKW